MQLRIRMKALQQCYTRTLPCGERVLELLERGVLIGGYLVRLHGNCEELLQRGGMQLLTQALLYGIRFLGSILIPLKNSSSKLYTNCSKRVFLAAPATGSRLNIGPANVPCHLPENFERTIDTSVTPLFDAKSLNLSLYLLKAADCAFCSFLFPLRGAWLGAVDGSRPKWRLGPEPDIGVLP